MNKLQYYFPDHWGAAPSDADVVLYEITWNNYAYHGFFEFQFRKNIKYRISNPIPMLSICRIDGTMNKRHELREIYSPSNKCFTRLNSNLYISFPTINLCLILLLNFSVQQRQEIAEKLCFNFGKGADFNRFKTTKQYRVSILRNVEEEAFIERLKECEKILFCNLELSDLLGKQDITINKSL